MAVSMMQLVTGAIMHRRIACILSIAAATFMLFGCATTNKAYAPAGITYHNVNKEKETFWMTVTKTSPDGTYQASALWYCHGGDKARCIQADMVKCDNAQNCQINASRIFQSVLGI